MKNYRSCIADAYVLEQVLCYLAEKADDCMDCANSYLAAAKEQAGDEPVDPDSYDVRNAKEYQEKAAAYERLLVKLTK